MRSEASPPVPIEPPTLAGRELQLGYGGPLVVEQFDTTIPTGRITAVIGANGCGKSTLLRALARLLRPSAGSVLLDGEDIHRQPTKEVAKRLGLLPQAPTAPDGIVVNDLVRRGRYPHQKMFDQWSPEDERAVARALDLTNMVQFSDRSIDELSGGQRQRAWIAMALAQDTPLLLLDEPTTYLDMAHQVDVLGLLASLNRVEGRTVVMVLHDVNQACRYADHLVAMAGGAVAVEGPPREVVTAELIEHVFGLPVTIIDDPVTGTPLTVPLEPAPRSAEPATGPLVADGMA
ncbi:MAG: ABC transporter ATP-binding protein [Actinomycetota bacterium]